ncbi:MAG: transcription termination/antitermination protein NusG [Slackia sp.]
MAKKWYVLHTYSGYENKVKKNLETRIETMGLENNVFGIEIPTETVTEIKESGRRVENEKKVFPGYVLVRMEMDDRSWAAVRNTPGVTGFVGSQGNPAPLTRDEFNKIMKRTSTSAPKKTTSSFEVGHSVKVTNGPSLISTAPFPRSPSRPAKSASWSRFSGRETPVELSFDHGPRSGEYSRSCVPGWGRASRAWLAVVAIRLVR